MSVRKGIEPLTVSEAIRALRGGARVYGHLPILADGIGREVKLSATFLRQRLEVRAGNESTRFILQDGDLHLV